MLWQLRGKDALQKPISKLVKDLGGLTERLSAVQGLGRTVLSPVRAVPPRLPARREQRGRAPQQLPRKPVPSTDTVLKLHIRVKSTDKQYISRYYLYIIIYKYIYYIKYIYTHYIYLKCYKIYL